MPAPASASLRYSPDRRASQAVAAAAHDGVDRIYGVEDSRHSEGLIIFCFTPTSGLDSDEPSSAGVDPFAIFRRLSSQLLPQNDRPLRVEADQMKRVLADVDADR